MIRVQELKYALPGEISVTYFYTEEYLNCEASCINGQNESVLLTATDSHLLCPILVRENYVGSAKLSYLPVPFYYGAENRKKLKMLLEHYMNILLKKNKPAYLRFDPLMSYDSRLLHFFLSSGFDANVHFTTIVNLQNTKSSLWSKVNKSYRSLINNVLKNYEVIVDDGENEQYLNDWIALYTSVTERGNSVPGKKTSKILIDADSVKKGRSFLFSAYNEHKKLISCVEINSSSKYAYYMHSAIHPDHEGKEAFTHALLWKAIDWLGERGFLSLEIGPVFYKGLTNYCPTEKELSISFFKLNMGGTLNPFLVLGKTL